MAKDGEIASSTGEVKAIAADHPVPDGQPPAGKRKCEFCRGYGCYSYIPLGRNGLMTVRCSDCRGTGFLDESLPGSREGTR